MANPLRDFISSEKHLFKELDSGAEGIGLYETSSVRSFLETILDAFLGKAVRVCVAGDTVVVDRRSAEAFFERNSDRFSGWIEEGMTVKEKVLHLLELSKRGGLSVFFVGLPRGLLEEYAKGGDEGRSLVVGTLFQFRRLVDALELHHGFNLPKLRKDLFISKEEGYLQFDRNEFVDRLVEESRERIVSLNDQSGRPELRALVSLIIGKIRTSQVGDVT